MNRNGRSLPERFLDNEEAAHYLKLSPRTLDRQRLTGHGPRFRKFGRRVVYAIEDLEAWADERICSGAHPSNLPASKASSSPT